MQRLISLLLVTLLFSLAACSQNNSKTAGNKAEEKDIKVGDGCEGCEAIYESPTAFEQLNHIDTLPDFDKGKQKISISGIVYNKDGKTPAAGVVIYIYHTDEKGIYATKGGEKGWGKRHGYIRGWVKTDKNGAYQFYTFRPASYPNSKNPQHIHVTVKEPGKTEYWIDEYFFADDPLFTQPANKPRGGNGVIQLEPEKNGISNATRHIILGMNVPSY